jgi:hypothetical protein
MTKTTGRGKADQDIIRAIGYITDDKYIAAYFGVDVKRVNHLRKEVSKSKVEPVRQVKLSENAKPTSYSSGMNSDSERRWNANAKAGSAALRDALFKFFEKRRLEEAALERLTR